MNSIAHAAARKTVSGALDVVMKIWSETTVKPKKYENYKK